MQQYGKCDFSLIHMHSREDHAKSGNSVQKRVEKWKVQLITYLVWCTKVWEISHSKWFCLPPKMEGYIHYVTVFLWLSDNCQGSGFFLATLWVWSYVCSIQKAPTASDTKKNYVNLLQVSFVIFFFFFFVSLLIRFDYFSCIYRQIVFIFSI